jgi:polar amino acid transport system substrate-binding protein
MAMLFAAPAPALAQEQRAELRVATLAVRPFVIKQGGQLTGFSMDVWNEVAARLKVTTTYQGAADAAAMAEPARAKDIDAIVSALYFTTERAREFDSSFPILEPGMQAMVPGATQGEQVTLLKSLCNLPLSQAAAMWLAVALLIILIPAHVIWPLDRGSEDSISPGRGYLPGIFHALL